MKYDVFANLYWKLFLMIEKEFRKAVQYVALSSDNYYTYSDFFSKVLLQIGSEIEVVAKLLCSEINPSSKAENIIQYGAELLERYPEIESVTICCSDMNVVPWSNWCNQSPTWWKIYNGVKHNRGEKEEYDGIINNNYKFANLKTTVTALAALYILELYLFENVTDANPNLETPIPGSRFFKAVDQGWEIKQTYTDTFFYIDNYGELIQFASEYVYSDL